MQNYNNQKKTYYENGNIKCERYFLDKKYHRTDGPAIIEYYESGELHRQAYCVNGQYFKTDGPAENFYHKSGKIQREHYYIKDEFHRIDGPAVIYYFEDGSAQLEGYWFKHVCIQMNPSVELMRKSINKTETLINILNNHKEQKSILAEILVNMFQDDIDPNVLNNITMFL